MISVRTHAVIDYIVGILLIAAPYLLDFATGGPAQWVPQALGAGILLYSLLTRYDLSLAKVIPFGAHLALDALGGLFLIASPGSSGLPTGSGGPMSSSVSPNWALSP